MPIRTRSGNASAHQHEVGTLVDYSRRQQMGDARAGLRTDRARTKELGFKRPALSSEQQLTLAGARKQLTGNDSKTRAKK